MFNLYIQNCHIILGPTIFSLPRSLDLFFPNLTMRRRNKAIGLFPTVGRNTFSSNGDALCCQNHGHVLLPLIAFVTVSAARVSRVGSAL
jgi:hypothetical protein